MTALQLFLQGIVLLTPPCPADMVLVERDHWDTLEFECTDLREGKYCHGYEPLFSNRSGPVTHVRACMDVYEAPNVRGAKPYVMQSGDGAAAWCSKHGKRLCTEQEWEAACEGDDESPYSYGWSADTTTCNQSRAWLAYDAAKLSAGGDTTETEVHRLWQGEPSGARAKCVTQEGVHDMLGNVEEWVRARPGRPFPMSLKGGFWSRTWTACRGTNDAHGPGFSFYEVGFRCCADPG